MFLRMSLYTIVNILCTDLRVDWRIFNVEKDDKKTLDLIVNYGEAFPKLDNSGKEIVPPWEGRPRA